MHIVNDFKYLLVLSEIEESYSHYYYIKVVRFSLDLLPPPLSLLMCCCKIIV